MRSPVAAGTVLACATGSTLLVILSALQADAQLSDTDLARLFFPREVREYRQEDFERGNLASEFFDFEAVDLDRTGRKDYLAVVYTGGRMAFRLLKRTGDRAEIVYEPENIVFGGDFGSVYVKDLDSDGVSEIMVGTRGNRDEGIWVFRWTGTDLELISSARSGRARPDTFFTNTQFVDLDGDGLFEGINNYAPGYEQEFERIYQLSDGRYVDSGRRAYSLAMIYGTDYKNSRRIEFSVPEPEATYNLRVVEGALTRGQMRDAVVRLNGSVVVTADQLSAAGGRVVVPVRLSGRNTMDVDMDADRLRYFYIVVESIPDMGTGDQ